MNDRERRAAERCERIPDEDPGEYLIGKDHCEHKESPCYGECREPVKQRNDGRWFVTMGHPGFNSEKNNFRGYTTRGSAMGAIRYYGSPFRAKMRGEK